MEKYDLGIDVGSTTVKVVALNENNHLVTSRYVKASGRPRKALAETLVALEKEIDFARITTVGFTGSGGGPIARQLGARHVNELVAQTHAIGEYHPAARTAIEIGGQDSKLLILERDPATGRVVLVDFSMNTLCAAGTGSFLDQQAERLGVRIEEEFADLALQSRSPARIAGRCTVFAKSDMIHLQQRGVSTPDILAGLCYALTRNFKSIIGRGKQFAPPILFQGGVACNQAVGRAFEDVLGLSPGDLIVPQHHRLMAAIGAALAVKQDPSPLPFNLKNVLAALSRVPSPPGGLVPLRYAQNTFLWQPPKHNGGPKTPVYLGVDVGSISTNVVLLDRRQRVVARCYLRTQGRPLDAVRRALQDMGREASGHVQIRGVGVTGSGRYLTGEYVGADVVRNEITAQARAAVAIDPTVDTVFEIGGKTANTFPCSRASSSILP